MASAAPVAVQAAADRTYTLHYDSASEEIVVSSNITLYKKIKINQIQSAMGNLYSNTTAMINDQQTWNFLDAIKDGIKRADLIKLNIYPSANRNADLEVRENAVVSRVTDNLIQRTWTKVRPATKMGYIDVHTFFWESGLGSEHFIKTLPSGIAKSITTIGTYIDPLSKPGVQWPPAGKNIELTSELMNLFGFGESKIKAKTSDSTTKTFTYQMVVGCGGCNANLCTIQRSNASTRDVNARYYKGNKTKNRLLSGGASQREKVKYVVVKGWGDKIQVLIYFMYYHILPSIRSTIMITNDMVVYTLCITLNLPCVYTGSYVHRPVPGAIHNVHQQGKPVYSIVEFTPGTPMENITRARINKINKIYAENGETIASIDLLHEKPDTPISIQGEMKTFPKEFYKILIQDMNILNINLRKLVETDISSLTVDQIKKDIDKITESYLIVPFIKIRAGRPVMLTARNAYTMDGYRYKPHVLHMVTPDPDATFYEIGIKYKTYAAAAAAPQRRKGGSRGGGDVITQEEMNRFPTSDHSPKWFTCTEEHLDDSLAPSTDREKGLFGKSDDTITVDLQSLLDDSFNKAFDSLFSQWPKKDLENIHETIYTLYIYECEVRGSANYRIEPADIERIIKEYDIRYVPYTEEQLKDSYTFPVSRALPVSRVSSPPKLHIGLRDAVKNLTEKRNLHSPIIQTLKKKHFTTPPPNPSRSQRPRSPLLLRRPNNGSEDNAPYTPPYIPSPIRQMNVLVNGGGRRRTHKKKHSKLRKTRKSHKN
jgi:hypothetical protein